METRKLQANIDMKFTATTRDTNLQSEVGERLHNEDTLDSMSKFEYLLPIPHVLHAKHRFP
jgi:hypothetical protein